LIILDGGKSADIAVAVFDDASAALSFATFAVH
jgi:hypothetical protein